MIDYKITCFHDGDFGIYVESDFAAMRGSEEAADGMIEVFETREAAKLFVQEGEALGYTFDGKNLLGTRRKDLRKRNGVRRSPY